MRCLLVFALVLSFGAHADTPSSASGATSPLGQTAREVASSVALVKSVFVGGKGSPVYIFPEDHSLRTGQYEEAVALIRLNRISTLSGLVLEGMTPRAAESAMSVPAMSSDVALAMLREGDISAGEFMRVIYRTILLPGETVETGDAQDVSEAQLCPLVTDLAFADFKKNGPAARISLDDLKASLQQRKSAIEDYNKLTAGESDAHPLSCADERTVEGDFERIFTTSNRIVKASSAASGFSWACPVRGETDSLQIDEELTSLKALSKVVSAGPEASQDNLKMIEEVKISLAARDAASEEMVRQASILSARGTGPVAVIVGAAHTSRVTSRLQEAGISYAVIQTNSLVRSPKQGQKMSSAAFERHFLGKPALDNPLNSALVPVVGPKCPSLDHHHPPPVIGLPWLQQKAKIYQALAEFGGNVLYGRPKDPQVIAGVVDEARANIIKDGTGQVTAVVVPINVLQQPPDKVATRWVVISRGSILAGDDKRNVEERLMVMAGDGGNGKEPPEGPEVGTGTPEENSGSGKEGPKEDSLSGEIFVGADTKVRVFASQQEAMAEASRMVK